MKIATIANVRVSNQARESKSLGKTLKVAFRGGSVTGLCVAGFGLLGMLLVYVFFGKIGRQIEPESMTVVANYLGISYIPFTMSITGYSLGCSVVALFNRVGGGIYTKAADMGADLVGKTEAHIPEDDPRNPAQSRTMSATMSAMSPDWAPTCWKATSARSSPVWSWLAIHISSTPIPATRSVTNC
jgi:K(+)-stimulated pyrophosphate-energized sodium pump